MISQRKHFRYLAKVRIGIVFVLAQLKRVMPSPEAINWLFVFKVVILKCKGRREERYFSLSC